jgi:hypothetical protein
MVASSAVALLIGSGAALALEGCELSQAYQESQLRNATTEEVCYAVTDPRRNTVGQGWAVRAAAAQNVAATRGLTCDYGYWAQIHAAEEPARANAIQQENEGWDRLNRQLGDFNQQLYQMQLQRGSAMPPAYFPPSYSPPSYSVPGYAPPIYNGPSTYGAPNAGLPCPLPGL